MLTLTSRTCSVYREAVVGAAAKQDESTRRKVTEFTFVETRNPISIDGPCGVLEGLYQDEADASGLALICHPNPVKGGTMLNKVVSTLQRTARDAGYSTLRFNYRGVGRSAGSHDMQQGEVDDAEAAVNWLLAQRPGLPLVLLGFSFGGFVAASLFARCRRAVSRCARCFSWRQRCRVWTVPTCQRPARSRSSNRKTTR